MPVFTALRLVSARHRGVLLPCLELDFDHLGAVSVAAVLAEPDRFVGETLADPLEGADYGRCKAMVMRARKAEAKKALTAMGIGRQREDVVSRLQGGRVNITV